MMKKQISRFIDGVVYGLGFSISFFLIAYIFTQFLIFQETHEYHPVYQDESSFQSEGVERSSTMNFRNLTIEEKVSNSSIIVLTEYKDAESGRIKAIIKEILKQDDDVEFQLRVGDEYPAAEVIRRGENVSYGMGSIVYLAGNPASLKMTSTYFTENDPRISTIRDLVSGD